MSLIVTFSGHVHKLGATTSKDFGNNTYFERELVVYVEGRYPKHIPCKVKGASCSKLDGFAIGDDITVTAEVEGREYDKKVDGVATGEKAYFLALDAYKFTKGQTAPADAPAQAQAQTDDVPF